MNQAKNIKVGDVVQFPCICFAPLRRGWNGWIFRAAIGIDHWPDEKAEVLGEDLGWQRPRLYNGLQTPFSAIIRSTLLGEEYRRRRLGKQTSEEKAAAIAMWDELADVVRRHAQAVQNRKDRS